MRYVGQEHTLTIAAPAPGGVLGDDAEAVAERVHSTSTSARSATARRGAGDRLRFARSRPPPLHAPPSRSRRPDDVRAGGAAGSRRRVVVHPRRRLSFRVSPRSHAARRDAELDGPAIVAEPTTTTYLDAGYTAEVHPAARHDQAVTVSVSDRHRAGTGAQSASPTPSDHHRDRPPGAQRRRRADEAGADPHVVLAGHLRGAGLRRRALRPRRPPARPGADAAHVHGHDELLRERRGRRRGRRGGARAGRHHPLQRPLRHGLAPAGRGRGDAGVPGRGRARRLRGDQGATGWTSAARTRTRPTPSTSSRRARSSRASSCTRAGGWSATSTASRSPTRRVPKMVAGDINAERRRRAHRRRGAGAGGRAARPRARSASASPRMYDHGEAIVRCGSRSSPTAATSATARWTPTASRRAGAVRGRGRDQRLDACASTTRTRPTQQAGPINCPRALDRLGQPDRHLHAGRRRRGAQRGPLPGDRGRDPAGHRCSTPSRRRPASSTAGPATRRSRSSTRRSRQALPEAVPACSGGDICALVCWGTREHTGEPWTDGAPHPIGQGASRARRRRQQADARLRGGHPVHPAEVWEAKNPWLMERVELAQDSCGAGPPPRRPRRRPLVPLARGRLA